MTVDMSRYQETFRRLTHETVACAPRGWNEGRLRLAFDGGSLHYVFESDSNQAQAVVTEELADLCAELYLLMQMDGRGWSQCVIGFTKTPADSWDFDVNVR